MMLICINIIFIYKANDTLTCDIEGRVFCSSKSILTHLGPFVQSILSLTRSLMENLLSLTVLTKLIVAVFYAVQKFLTFFSKTMAAFLHMIHLKF